MVKCTTLIIMVTLTTVFIQRQGIIKEFVASRLEGYFGIPTMYLGMEGSKRRPLKNHIDIKLLVFKIKHIS